MMTQRKIPERNIRRSMTRQQERMMTLKVLIESSLFSSNLESETLLCLFARF